MKERRRCWQRRRRLLFGTCYGATPAGSAAFGIRGSEMMRTESMNQGHACQATIAARKPRRTQGAGVQEGCMPSEPPQASGAQFAANLHNRRAFAIHINRRHLPATWPSATTSRRGIAICSLSELRRAILAVLGPRALPGPDHHTPWAQVRPSGAQRSITPRHRPAIDGVPGAGRHDVEGGQAYVLAVPGSAHSQAPPMARTDGAARQDHDARTAM